MKKMKEISIYYLLEIFSKNPYNTGIIGSYSVYICLKH